MINHTSNTRLPSWSRRGLAPLELVLALPLLLMVMGLMVLFGNAAFWKVRGLTVARHAAWSTRWPRNDLVANPPPNWQPGVMRLQGAAAIDALDDPAIDQPVVRGPRLGNFGVDDQRLAMSRGVVDGQAEITRTPVMLARMGDLHYDLDHPLLDDRFQYPQMHVPANRYRRIPYLYELPKADASLSQAFAQTIHELLRAPYRNDLRPLDRDDELNALFGFSPDFHPRVQSFCGLEYQEIWEDQVRELIGRIKGRRRRPPQQDISGVPERMADVHLAMYRQLLQQIQSGNLQPPPSEAELQSNIDVLQQFRSELRDRPNSGDGPMPTPLGPLPF